MGGYCHGKSANACSFSVPNDKPIGIGADRLFGACKLPDHITNSHNIRTHDRRQSAGKTPSQQRLWQLRIPPVRFWKVAEPASRNVSPEVKAAAVFRQPGPNQKQKRGRCRCTAQVFWVSGPIYAGPRRDPPNSISRDTRPATASGCPDSLPRQRGIRCRIALLRCLFPLWCRKRRRPA